MYFSIILLLSVLMLCLLLCILHRNIAIKKVSSLSCKEKCDLLDSILSPFGYRYDKKQDIVSTHNLAWQRRAGYTGLFDRTALHFHMVFDALPVYFDYQGRTWLIELWKGQYGINTGAEIGIYHADRILSRNEFDTVRFQAVADADRLPVSFTLLYENQPLATVSDTAWWLTAFLVGTYSSPGQLSMDCVLHFPDFEMLCRFTDSLKRTAPHIAFHCHGTDAHIDYAQGCPLSPVCPEPLSCFKRLRIRWAQFCNRLFCRLYCLVTRPFVCTLDKLLYLYYLMPFILRRLLRRLKGVIRP